MKILKKVLQGLLGVAVMGAFCFAVLYFLLPDFLGKRKDEDETTELITEEHILITTQEKTEIPTEATTNPFDVLTETTTEYSFDHLTEASTQQTAEGTTSHSSINVNPNNTDSNLVDTKAPFFLIFNSSPTVHQGEVFNIHKFVGYADDVDRDVDIELVGELDILTTGSYPIEVVLTDDAGHTTSRSMEVTVVEPEPYTPSSGGGGNGGGGGGGSYKPENFSKFVENYKTDTTSVGIDISRWQEEVDFEKVKAAGCEFVYMRLGGNDNGERYTDKYYRQNMAGAKAAGLKVGIYWHAEESNIWEVATSVNYLMQVLDGETLDLPIAYDWEDFANFEDYKMNVADFNGCFESFAYEVGLRGYSACLYSSKNFLEVIWENNMKYPVWLAHYTSATSYSGSYFMWQQSSSGRIDGINNDVDLDVLYYWP